MKTSLKVLFILVSSRVNKTYKVAIKCRVTYLKKRKECSTGLLINPKNWNAKKQFVEPPEPDAELINT
ncbi:Arm DNA-binding domain-containing protein [Aestuariivivens sediminis]|uniref:Arm DNA-binding domain-containing protein n=1 Tax=Aestuariivivens sediminis TaxID=2913557 RepID=UPI001F57BE77|nr:Arm DNA-binding domain-containing protein [Aestuariivivens sediminis]